MAIKVTGSGPFPLPGERKRAAKAEASARKALAACEAAEKRGKKK